jgi:hypothetical protein
MLREVDAVQHFGAGRARQGLCDAEKLLILREETN